MKVDNEPDLRRIGGVHRTDLVTQVNDGALFRYIGPVVMDVLLRSVPAASGRHQASVTVMIVGGIQ
jgi:hypothetical protein